MTVEVYYPKFSFLIFKMGTVLGPISLVYGRVNKPVPETHLTEGKRQRLKH